MRALSLAGKLLVGAECLGLEVVGGQRKQRLPRELMLCEQKGKGGVDDSPRRHSTNKQAGSSKLGGCERMSALTFLSRPAFLLSAFSSFTGLSPGSSTVCDHREQKGCAVCFLSGKSTVQSRLPFSLTSLFFGPVLDSDVQAPARQPPWRDLGLRGQNGKGHNLLLTPVTDLSTRGSWAERDASIYPSQGSDGGFRADGCISRVDDVLSPSFLLLPLSMSHPLPFYCLFILT